MIPDMDALIRHEFPVHSGRIHLNHAAVAPWPRRTVEAVRRFALENLPDRPYCYADWLKREQQLREQCRRLLNASGTDEIALLKTPRRPCPSWPWAWGSGPARTW